MFDFLDPLPTSTSRPSAVPMKPNVLVDNPIWQNSTVSSVLELRQKNSRQLSLAQSISCVLGPQLYPKKQVHLKCHTISLVT